MKTSYIRFSRRFSIPSTAQILDELKFGYVEGYIPISQGYKMPLQRKTEVAKHAGTRKADI